MRTPTVFIDSGEDAEKHFDFYSIGFQELPDDRSLRERLLKELSQGRTDLHKVPTVDQWIASDENDLALRTPTTYTVRRSHLWELVDMRFDVFDHYLWEWLRTNSDRNVIAILEMGYLPLYELSFANAQMETPDGFPDMYVFPPTWEWLAIGTHESNLYVMVADKGMWVPTPGSDSSEQP